MTLRPLPVPLMQRVFPRVDPVPGDVRDFWKFMQLAYGTRVVEKAKSTDMQAAAKLLDLMGIVDETAFMTRFTTTIGTTIYAPFIIGYPESGWDLWSQIVICAHEHQHVWQDKQAGGLLYEWDYVISTAARTRYEIEAYRTGMELNWRYQNRMQSPSALAALLKNYGCSATDIKVATKALGLAIPAIKAGGLTTEVGRKAGDWLDARFRKAA